MRRRQRWRHLLLLLTSFCQERRKSSLIIFPLAGAGAAVHAWQTYYNSLLGVQKVTGPSIVNDKEKNRGRGEGEVSSFSSILRRRFFCSFSLSLSFFLLRKPPKDLGRQLSFFLFCEQRNLQSLAAALVKT